MSDINQLRYELQQLIARYPDFQIDLSQIRVTQSVSLMPTIPPYQQPNYQTYQPQTFPVGPPTAYYPTPVPPTPLPNQKMTQLISRSEGVEIIPPPAHMPSAADASAQDAAAAAVAKSLSRKIKPIT